MVQEDLDGDEEDADDLDFGELVLPPGAELDVEVLATLPPSEQVIYALTGCRQNRFRAF